MEDEIYFSIDVNDPEINKEVVELGDLAYWPQVMPLSFLGQHQIVRVMKLGLQAQ